MWELLKRTDKLKTIDDNGSMNTQGSYQNNLYKTDRVQCHFIWHTIRANITKWLSGTLQPLTIVQE